jgi:hypothetical protein
VRLKIDEKNAVFLRIQEFGPAQHLDAIAADRMNQQYHAATVRAASQPAVHTGTGITGAGIEGNPHGLDRKIG